MNFKSIMPNKINQTPKYFVWYIKYLYEMSRKWKSIETESVLVVAYGRVSQIQHRDWTTRAGQRMENKLTVNVHEGFYWVKKIFWNWFMIILQPGKFTFKTTELYTWNRWIIYVRYVYKEKDPGILTYLPNVLFSFCNARQCQQLFCDSKKEQVASWIHLVF